MKTLDKATVEAIYTSRIVNEAYARLELSQNDNEAYVKFMNEMNSRDLTSIKAIMGLIESATDDNPVSHMFAMDKESAFIVIEELYVLGVFDEFSTKIAETVLKYKRCSSKQLYCLARSVHGKVKVSMSVEGGYNYELL